MKLKSVSEAQHSPPPQTPQLDGMAGALAKALAARSAHIQDSDEEEEDEDFDDEEWED